jgi:hypothetical protein
VPPRFAYWTILAGGLPTAFRATEKEDLLPTFRRLLEKHPDAEMRWFARGKLWASPEEARAGTAPRPLREPDGKPRGRDWRPGGTHRDARQPFKDAKREKNQVLRKERFKRKHGPPPLAAATGARPAPSRRETVSAAAPDRPAKPLSAPNRPLPAEDPAARPLQTEAGRMVRPLPKSGAKTGARAGYPRPNATTQTERRSEHATGHRTRSTRGSGADVARAARPLQTPASRSERPLPAQDVRAKRPAQETRTTRPLPAQGTRPVGGAKHRAAAPKTAARPVPPRPRSGDKRDSSRWRR